MSKVLMLSGTCGHHHDKGCDTCKAAQECTDAEIRKLHAEIDRLRAALAAKPWPPSDADLLAMLADIVGAWWSEATGKIMRRQGYRPNVEDIKGMYAVRDALAPYVARAALSTQTSAEGGE